MRSPTRLVCLPLSVHVPLFDLYSPCVPCEWLGHYAPLPSFLVCDTGPQATFCQALALPALLLQTFLLPG